MSVVICEKTKGRAFETGGSYNIQSGGITGYPVPKVGCFSHRRGPARWGSHVARLNFKTSRVGAYKCLSLIVGFAVTVAIWPREVLLLRFHFTRCCNFLGHVACRNLPWQGLTEWEHQLTMGKRMERTKPD